MRASRWLKSQCSPLYISLLLAIASFSLLSRYLNRDKTSLRSNFVDLIEDDGSMCIESERLLLSNTLPSKAAFPLGDENCAQYQISYLKPGCILPRALVSYPGSGNTWLRYLLDVSLGVFTGSRYKDLDIQSSGMWGEIRPWLDGSTIVQKTHDASYDHVIKDFHRGRGILLIRNPYEAILANRNFLYGGHVGLGKKGQSFESPEWRAFISSQMGKWLNTAMNWTVYSSPKELTVVHLEDIKENTRGSLEDLIRRVFNIDPHPGRLKCMLKHRNGYFHRSHQSQLNVIPFRQEERKHVDEIIDYLNDILIRKGYRPLPLHAYNYYRSTDEEIRAQIMRDNHEAESAQSPELDDTKGLEMVLKSYIKKVDKKGELFNVESGPLVSEYTLRIFSKALKLWPAVQESFRSQDPIVQENEKDTSGIMKLEDIPLPNI